MFTADSPRRCGNDPDDYRHVSIEGRKKGVKVKKDASKLIARAVLKALSGVMKIMLKKSP